MDESDRSCSRAADAPVACSQPLLGENATQSELQRARDQLGVARK
jgi:hypothetical protein